VGALVTLSFSQGDGVQVFFPSLEFDEGDKTEYLLWVAEDGSTYWANTNSDETHHGDGVTRSALYAMQYDDANLWDKGLVEDYRWDGLACGAFDARVARWGLAQARSPGVDAGSEDAWGYDSTSTNPKVIDMKRPDIGYKYYRRVADDDPQGSQTVTISFRQPALEESSPAIKGYRIRDEFDAEVSFRDSDLHSLSGKDVVLWPLENEFPLESRYIPRLHTVIEKADSSQLESQAVEFELIVDRTPPNVQ